MSSSSDSSGGASSSSRHTSYRSSSSTEESSSHSSHKESGTESVDWTCQDRVCCQRGEMTRRFAVGAMWTLATTILLAVVGVVLYISLTRQACMSEPIVSDLTYSWPELVTIKGEFTWLQLTSNTDDHHIRVFTNNVPYTAWKEIERLLDSQDREIAPVYDFLPEWLQSTPECKDPVIAVYFEVFVGPVDISVDTKEVELDVTAYRGNDINIAKDADELVFDYILSDSIDVTVKADGMDVLFWDFGHFDGPQSEFTADIQGDGDVRFLDCYTESITASTTTGLIHSNNTRTANAEFTSDSGDVVVSGGGTIDDLTVSTSGAVRVDRVESYTATVDSGTLIAADMTVGSGGTGDCDYDLTAADGPVHLTLESEPRSVGCDVTVESTTGSVTAEFHGFNGTYVATAGGVVSVSGEIVNSTLVRDGPDSVSLTAAGNVTLSAYSN